MFVVPGEHPILAPDDESLDMDNDAPGEFFILLPKLASCYDFFFSNYLYVVGYML